jgi:hypothetical protein
METLCVLHFVDSDCGNSSSARSFAGALVTKYAFALMREAATNTFREFWPDIAAHLPHRYQ